MNADVRLQVVRACLVNGERHEPGAKLMLSPATALDAIETGRLQLVDDGDFPRCLAARRAALNATLRRVPDPLGSPWQPAGAWH